MDFNGTYYKCVKKTGAATPNSIWKVANRSYSAIKGLIIELENSSGSTLDIEFSSINTYFVKEGV